MQHKFIALDIETGPLPDEQLERLYEPLPAEQVKIGNRKPESAADYIAEKQAEHRREFFERAALDALTGRVICLGLFYPPSGPETPLDQGLITIVEAEEPRHEAKLLELFWQTWRERDPKSPLVGHYVRTFDVPFLIRRSWLLGLHVPQTIWEGRYLSPNIIDTRELFGLGDRLYHTSLDKLSKAFGLEGKPDSVSKNFAEVYASDREKALGHLENDLKLTAGIARRILCN